MVIVAGPAGAHIKLSDLEMDESSAARLIKMQYIHKTVSVDGVGKVKMTGSREQGK